MKGSATGTLSATYHDMHWEVIDYDNYLVMLLSGTVAVLLPLISLVGSPLFAMTTDSCTIKSNCVLYHLQSLVFNIDH